MVQWIQRAAKRRQRVREHYPADYRWSLSPRRGSTTSRGWPKARRASPWA